MAEKMGKIAMLPLIPLHVTNHPPLLPTHSS